jgi:thioredoxin-related protein
MKTLPIVLSLAALLLLGCSDHKSEAKRLASPAQEESSPGASASETASPKQAEPAPSAAQTAPSKASASTAGLSRFYQVFNDAAKIDPAGKPMLLVFGQSADPYTQRLMQDVTSDEKLAAEIRADVTPIYLDARAPKRHKFMHNGQTMEVDTKTLVSIYHIDATPTMIFTDEEGKTIFIVPGYMPPKQFKVTLRFIKEGAWKGKDRKNGEIYRALKEYYESHGVHIGGAKK